MRVHVEDLRRRNRAGLSTWVDVDRGHRGPEYVLNTALSAGTDYQLARVRRWEAYGDPVQREHSVRLRWRRDVAIMRMSRATAWRTRRRCASAC